MSAGRKIGIVLLCLIVLGGAIGGVVYYLTSGAADAANAFLATVVRSGPEAAYKSSAKAFQASVPEEKFVAFADRFALRRFKSASWPNREVTIGQADVKGTVTFEDGLTRPAEIKLLKEDGAWRVFSIDLGAAGPRAAPSEPPPASPALPPAPAPVPAPPPAPQPPAAGGALKKVDSSSQPGDEIAARIGDADWSLKGKDILVVTLGDKVLVNAITMTKPQPGGISVTTISLQFRPGVSGPQTLTRDCSGESVCIELSKDGNQFKVDQDPNAKATVEVTKAENGAVEGTFSADMISLDGRTKIEGGRFRLSAGAK